MNFFEQQDQARRRTTWLVVLFLLSIACVALSFYGLALFVIVPQAQDRGAKGSEIWWNPQIFMEITGAVCLIIFLGAGVQRLRLGGTGKSVAEALGGQPLQGATDNADEQKLRDVVDEMAIASGMPVPPIYILQEDAINAFAAGKNPQDAVLGFTRGAITQLNRDELQGVTGHEFSHVAHKDTRLNLRIACVVSGVMLIALIGRVMLQVAGRIATAPRMSSKKDDRGGAALAFLAIGLGLLVVGGVGAFFGRLLQAAVSRQREFLADASAVQYSRNPAGIASALRKIGGLPFTPIQSPAASGLNHFFFSKSINSWLSTHPPLPERIHRIEQGGFISDVVGRSSDAVPIDSIGVISSSGNLAAGFVGDGASRVSSDSAIQLPKSQSDVRAATHADGRPLTRDDVLKATTSMLVPQESLDGARALLKKIPDAVQIAAREPLDVQAVLLLLVTDPQNENRDQVRALALNQLGESVVACWDRLASSMLKLPDEIRLVVLDLCVPTLTQLTKQQYVAFRTTLTAAMRSDSQIDLFEWMTRIVLTRRIETRFGAMSQKKPTRSMRECSQEMRIVLGTLARAGGSDHPARTFDLGATACQLNALSFPSASECALDALHQSLEGLDALAPGDRQLLAKALVSVAAADDVYNTQELLLLRAFAYRLDIHLPLI
ncbi:Zn-dependent protease [Phycisphaerae bacterium]|nr:Zn-dependent protease [Phycisphaerae bacterium]